MHEQRHDMHVEFARDLVDEVFEAVRIALDKRHL